MNRNEMIRHLTQHERDCLVRAATPGSHDFWQTRLDTQLAWLEPLSDAELRRRVGVARIATQPGAHDCHCDVVGENCVCTRVDSADAEAEAGALAAQAYSAGRQAAAEASNPRFERRRRAAENFPSAEPRGGTRTAMVERNANKFKPAK